MKNKHLKIGITEWHGVAHELAQFPPDGIEYCRIDPIRKTSPRIIRSPIKGYLRTFETNKCDLIEAILSPIQTHSRWIYSIANAQEALAFNAAGLPIPRALRVAYLLRLLKKHNFKKLIFWSHAGFSTLSSYSRVSDPALLSKTTVVYPAIRTVPDPEPSHNESSHLQLLFSGDFFRKGGAHVVDAFERASALYPELRLRLCCDDQADFNTDNTELRATYLNRIHKHPNIITGRASRSEMIGEILPNTHIYLLPTYAEAFGYSVLESMAFSIPVIATNHFAIPEMITNKHDGLLINIDRYDCERLFRGYRVNKIPPEFHEYMTETLFGYLCKLIENPKIRIEVGQRAAQTARTKFSFEERNKKMLSIYHDALFS